MTISHRCKPTQMLDCVNLHVELFYGHAPNRHQHKSRMPHAITFVTYYLQLG